MLWVITVSVGVELMTDFLISSLGSDTCWVLGVLSLMNVRRTLHNVPVSFTGFQEVTWLAIALSDAQGKTLMAA